MNSAFDYFKEIKDQKLRNWNQFNFAVNLKEQGGDSCCRDYLDGLSEADLTGVTFIGRYVKRKSYKEVEKEVARSA